MDFGSRSKSQSSNGKAVGQAKRPHSKGGKNAYKGFNNYNSSAEMVKPTDYFPRNSQIEYNSFVPFKKRDVRQSMDDKKEKKAKQKDHPKDQKSVVDEADISAIEFQSEEVEGQVSRCLRPKFAQGDLLLVSIFEIRKDYMLANFTRNIKIMIHRDYTGYAKDQKFQFSDYFKIGQFVSVAVLSTSNKNYDHKSGSTITKVLCSIEPHVINVGIEPTNLRVGMDLWGKITLDTDGRTHIPYLGLNAFDQVVEKFNKKLGDDDEDEYLSEASESEENPEQEEVDENIYEEAKSDDSDVEMSNSAPKSHIKFNITFSEQALKLISADSNFLQKGLQLNTRLESYHYFRVVNISKQNNSLSIIVDFTDSQPALSVDKIEFNTVRPGMIFKCVNTKKEIVNGIEVKFADQVGTIFEDHVTDLNIKKLSARVIHVSNEKMKFALSANINIIQLKNSHPEKSVELINKVFKDSEFSISPFKKLFGDSYIVEITKKNPDPKYPEKSIKAFIHSSHVFKDEESVIKSKERKKNKNERKSILSATDTSKTDNVTLPQNVRIKEFNFFDGIAILKGLTEEDEKENEFLNWDNIEIGQKIRTTINAVNANFIELRVNGYISGFLYKEHITDVSLKLKNLSKFKEGSKLVATVFDCNNKTKQLLFTLKPALSQIKNRKAIKEGDQLNFVYLEHGLFQHCGGVKGKLMNFENLNKELKFKSGNVYELVIYRINHDKILLTNKNEKWHPSLCDYDLQVSVSTVMTLISSLNSLNIKTDEEEHFEGLGLIKDSLQGKLVNCKLIKVKKLLDKHSEGKVTVEEIEEFDSKYKVCKFEVDSKTVQYGYIPIELLSDFHSESIFENVKYGSSIDCLILHNNTIINSFFLSAKHSLITNKELIFNGTLENNNMSCGKTYVGFISKIGGTSVTISFIGNKKVNVNNPKIKDSYSLGQTVVFSRIGGKIQFESLYSRESNENLIKEASMLLHSYLSDSDTLSTCFYENIKGLEKILLNGVVESRIVKDRESYHKVKLDFSVCESQKFVRFLGYLSHYECRVIAEKKKNDKDLIEGSSSKFQIDWVNHIERIIYLKKENRSFEVTDVKVTEAFFQENLGKEVKIHIEKHIPESAMLVGYAKGKQGQIIHCIIPFNFYNFNNIKLLERKAEDSVYLQTLKKFADTKVVSLKLSSVFSSDRCTYILTNIPEVLIENVKIIFTHTGAAKINIDNVKINDVVQGRVSGIKGVYIYVYFGKNLMGRIHFNNYKGDISLLLSQLELGKKDILIKGRIARSTNIKGVTFFEMLPEIAEHAQKDSEKGKDSIEGIVSYVLNKSVYPIRVDFGFGLNLTQVKIPFYNIPASAIEIGQALSETSISIGERLTIYKQGEEFSLIQPKHYHKKHFEDEKIYVLRILKKISGRGLVLSLCFNKENEESKYNAFCDITEVTDNCISNPLDYHQLGSIVLGRIIKYDSQLGKYFVSLRESIIDESTYKLLKNGTTTQVTPILERNPADLRNRLFKYGMSNVVETNHVAIGYITSASEKGVFIKLSSDVTIRTNLKEISDSRCLEPFNLVNENQLTLLRIVSVHTDEKDKTKLKISASLRESVVKYGLTLKLKDINHNCFYNCVINGEAKSGKQTANIVGSTFSGELDKKTNYEIGKIVILQIINISKEAFPPSKIIFSEANIVKGFDTSMIINPLEAKQIEDNRALTKLWEEIAKINEEYNVNRDKSEVKEIEILTKDINLEDNLEEDHKFIEELVQRENDDVEDINVADAEESSIEEDEIDDSQINEEEDDDQQNNQDDVDFEDEENVQSTKKDEEYDEEEYSKDKKKSSKKREKESIKEELKIRAKEKSIVDRERSGHESLESFDDFEKKILLEPNSAENWIKYAAFILENMNYEAAKKIFERAVKTVDMSLLKEKLNIWVAYLNLINQFGEGLEFKEVAERALQVNNKLQIYKHLILIYKKSGKLDICYEVYKIAIKNSPSNIKLWQAYLNFVFANQDTVEGIAKPKEILQHALSKLVSKNETKEMLVYNAGLLYEYGKEEEGKTSFEILIKNYPKQGDIILAYLGKEVHFNSSIATVRSLFHKMIEKQLKPKLLNEVIRNYRKFEEEKGSEADQKKVSAYLTQVMNTKIKQEQIENENEENDDDQMNLD